MAVFLETSAGDIVVDLYVKQAPLASKNFLKLCKIKYYNGHLFYNVQQNFMVQSGDPTGTGRGGTSVYGLLYGEQAKYFQDEVSPTLKHNRPGLLCMASHGPNTNGSQFFFTTRGEDLEHLDGKNTIFGHVAEGMEVLMKINTEFCDDDGRPYRDIRILHTSVLDDPFDDPPQLEVPDASPERERPEEERLVPRLGIDEDPDKELEGKDTEELELLHKRKEAQSRAVVLEMIGDIPDAEMKPPENVLFVCKLNPVTRDDDLELIFSRFGKVNDCEIIRDHQTGDSLNYAFVEFENVEDCEQAYFKMNNVLIDDRRIKVDFSQSVSKLWNRFNQRHRGKQGQGVKNTNRQAKVESQSLPESKEVKRSGSHKPSTRVERRSSTKEADYFRSSHHNRQESGDDRVRGREDQNWRDSRRGHHERSQRREHRGDRIRRTRSKSKEKSYRKERFSRSPDDKKERREGRLRSRSRSRQRGDHHYHKKSKRR